MSPSFSFSLALKRWSNSKEKYAQQEQQQTRFVAQHKCLCLLLFFSQCVSIYDASRWQKERDEFFLWFNWRKKARHLRERDGRVWAQRDVITIFSSSRRKSESLCSRREEECSLCVCCVCFCASCVEQQQRHDRDYHRRGISLISLSRGPVSYTHLTLPTILRV